MGRKAWDEIVVIVYIVTVFGTGHLASRKSSLEYHEAPESGIQKACRIPVPKVAHNELKINHRSVTALRESNAPRKTKSFC